MRAETLYSVCSHLQELVQSPSGPVTVANTLTHPLSARFRTLFLIFAVCLRMRGVRKTKQGGGSAPTHFKYGVSLLVLVVSIDMSINGPLLQSQLSALKEKLMPHLPRSLIVSTACIMCLLAEIFKAELECLMCTSANYVSVACR